MNFKEFETAEKLRGGFYTEPAIASFLVRWTAGISPKRVLEPSCGDGAFLAAVIEHCAGSRVTACEFNPEESRKAQQVLGRRGTVITGDFLKWFLTNSWVGEPFDAVVGNPPFIRYQYLPEQQQVLAEKIFAQFHLPFTKHTNAWVPFVLAAVASLRPGGRLAMVLPSEIFHIPHAQSLRKFLAQECSRIFLFDPEQIWFEDTLQGTVLLLAEKKLPGEKVQGVAVASVSSKQMLSGNADEYLSAATYTNGETITGKWMPVLLTPAERSLMRGLRSTPTFKTFDEVASVDVGIVTGANSFFLVDDDVVKKYGLSRWAHPMFGRSDHVQGIVYSEDDHEANKRLGLPANFLWFNEESEQALPNGVRAYLALGESQKLHTRYKCRVRSPWFRVPSVYTSPLAMLKRAHHFPRLVLNKAAAYTTDTAYRIQVKSGVTAQSLVGGFVNTVTALSAELEGRHYGGGVLELVPSEIERLLVPAVGITASQLQAADRLFRREGGKESFLFDQDALVLTKAGLVKRDQERLQSAWRRLRDRRQRVSTADSVEEAA